MKNISTEIIIEASPANVWAQLMDFDSYPDWNPFIHITGKAAVGTSLKNTIYLEGQKPQVFKPTVLVVKPQHELRWLGSLFVKGLFDGEHYFLLEETEEGFTRFTHGENFTGILSGVILKMIREQTKVGFGKMNEALKARVERKS